jgi:hypothetical protein
MIIFDNTKHRFRRKKGVRVPQVPSPTCIFAMPFPITLAKPYILDLCAFYRVE